MHIYTQKNNEGYLNSFDFITFEKIISKQSIFVFDRKPICNSAKCKMKFTGHWLQYTTTSNVTTLFTESSQAIKFALKVLAANLTRPLLIF